MISSQMIKKRMFGTFANLGGIAVLSFVAPFMFGATNEQESLQITVNDSRPIALAIAQLERRHGLVLTYEDCSYVHESDMTDVTLSVRKDLDQFPPGQAPRVLIPKRAALQIQYEIFPETGHPQDPIPVIQAILDAHALGGNPGTFSVTRSGNWIHVIPQAVKDDAGNLKAETSPLDVRISLPAQDRSVMSLIQELWKEVDKVIPEKLIFGLVPTNMLFQHRTDIGATDEVARQVLVKALSTIDVKLSWQLFYDPGLKWYVLNIHAVVQEGK